MAVYTDEHNESRGRALHKLFHKELNMSRNDYECTGGRAMNSSLIPVLLLLIVAFTAPALGQINTSQLNESEWFNDALTLYSQDRYNDSIQAFNKVIEIDPGNVNAWKMRGIDFGYLGNSNEALASFYRAASTNSSDAEIWYDIGVVYDMEGDLDSAIKAYNRATEINPNYQNAWFRKDQDMDTMGIGHSSLYNELTGHTS
jgi:tetratricopeptide (TPR) repeat protein